MALWDFSIFLSLRLLIRTIPFLFLRILVVLAFAAVLCAGIWVGVATVHYLGHRAIVSKTDLWFVIGGLIGFGLGIAIVRWLRSWALYLVKAAHVAVLVELIRGRPLSGTRGQIGHGRAVVRERLGEASALFFLDRIIRAALRGIDRLTLGLFAFLPRKTGAQVAAALRTLLHFALGSLDELMLAHAIDRQSGDPLGSAREALVLYAQNWTVILRNAIWLTVFAAMVEGPLVWFMFLPAWEGYQANQSLAALPELVVATLVMWAVAEFLIGPFALISLIQVWFRAISDDRPSFGWSARIDDLVPDLAHHRTPLVRTWRAGGTTRNGDLV